MNESAYPNATNLQRQLSSLKVISRLLGHELHTQTGGKSITLSREEVLEIQTSLDLYIEEATRAGGGAGRSQTTSLGDTTLVPTRN
ncbi:MAG: hypothetical protein H6829_07380 [Planctomycetes bacterium]|nr:hypothetical protein [Planctomycetota bacterium]HPF12872.1 hypothetical protein [Planctomycetota bacterium]HRV82739.1 hypothetical protein [Planctomycetota bacterium]